MVASESVLVRGNDVGFLLIHGFGGRPADLRPLADELIARGYTVHVPMLPGHGSTPTAMQAARWRDWLVAVTEAHTALRTMCREVVLIGHSMGGMLAVAEAAQRPPALLVLIGMPTFIGDWRVRFIPIAKYAIRWWYPLTDAALDDPVVQERVRHHSPDVDMSDPAIRLAVRQNARIPMEAVDHFFRLTRYARKLIRTIKTPTLIVHGRNDTVAVPICAEEIYRDLASEDKELAWIEEGGHQLLIGKHGNQTIGSITGWLERHVRP
jgi:carboxylesterase